MAREPLSDEERARRLEDGRQWLADKTKEAHKKYEAVKEAERKIARDQGKGDKKY